MAIEDDILATLKRIESAIKSSSGSTASRATTAGSAARGQTTGPDKNGTKTFKATVAEFDSLNDSASTLNKSFTSLNKTVGASRAGFVAMNKQLRAMRPQQGGTKTPTIAATPPAPPTPPRQNIFGGLFAGGNRGPLQQAGQNLRQFAGGVSYTTVALTTFLTQLAGAVKPVINDFFSLHARGIDAASSLGGLYIDAVKAGVSLKDYIEVLSSATPAVMRAANFDEFGKTIQKTNDQLAGLGVFGKQATLLSAELANATTVLGIPQAQIGAAAKSQIEMYKQLRDASGMTAEAFRGLVSELANNQTVQSQLLGLSGQERQARFNELTQLRTLGTRMGATTDASKALGDALIEQRKLTASQRFQSAGLVRQAGAMFGVNPDDTETLARLARKKNLSADEAATATQLGSQLQAAIEKELNSGDIQREYRAEEIQSRLDQAGIGRFLTAAGNVGLTASSGPLQNKDFSHGASELVKGAGLLLSYAKGLSENPIAEAVSKALGSAAFSFGLGVAFNKVISKLPFFGRGAKAAASGAAAAGDVAAGGGLIASVTKTVSNVFDVVKSGVSSIFNFFTKPFKVPNLGIVDGIVKIADSALDAWDSFTKFFRAIRFNVDLFGPLQTLKSAGGIVMDAVGGIGKWFGSLLGGVKEAASLASGVLEAGGGIMKVVSQGFKFLGVGLKSIPLIGNLIGVFVDSIGEVFTGNVAAAFNADGAGWLERIGGVVFAGINGIFGGIFGLVDDAVKFFGGEGWHLENAWDKFAVLMKAGLMLSLAKIVGAIPVVGDKAAKYFQDSADASFAVLQKLEEDNASTVTSIGAANQEVNKKLADQKDAAKKATDASTAVTTSFNAAAGVLNTTKNLTPTLIGTAKQVNAQVSPVPPTRPGVTPPDVNKADQNKTPDQQQQTQGTTSQPPASNQPDMATQLAQVIQLLQQMLGAELQQADYQRLLAAQAGAPTFADASRLVDFTNRTQG